MKKTIVTLSAVALIGFGSIASPVSAESVSNLENRQQSVRTERSEIQSSIANADAQLVDLVYELEILNDKIAKTNKELQVNEDKLATAKNSIAKIEKEIAQLEDEIVELEIRFQERFDQLKARFVAYQKSGGDVAFLDVLTGASDFSDFIARAKAIETISQSDVSLMESLEKDKAELDKKKEAVDKKLKEQEEVKKRLEDLTNEIKSQKSQLEQDKSSLETKRKQLDDKKASLQIKDSDLASLESEIRSQIAAATAPPAPVVQTNVADRVTEAASEHASRNTNNSSRPASNPARNAPASSQNNVSQSATPVRQTSTPQPQQQPKKQEAPAPAQPSRNYGSAISAGYSVMGTPYVWGGKAPGGFDCSGFVSWAYKQAGVSIPSYTGALASTGTKVPSLSQAQPGDLVFFNTNGYNGHVGIYLGGGQFIGAQSSKGVSVANMSSGYWKGQFSGTIRRVK